ncbi:hypothetical protein BDQ17DRAFT_1169681, partial [Cyathus striatus]
TSLTVTDTTNDRLWILQLNIRKSPVAHLELINRPLGEEWDIILIQEPHILFTHNIRTPNNFRPVFPANRFTLEETVHSVIWVNSNIPTNNWTIIDVPGMNDISAIQIRQAQKIMNIFNIYNDCENSDSL